MPSFYMHERAALTSLGELCDKSAAALGACGPDALYFSGAGELRALGKRLHCERTSEFLVYILRACADDAACRDYAMGFLSHYAVDVAFHPFVYALSTMPLGYSSLRHIATERALDAWLMGVSRVPRASAPDESEISEINARLGAAIMLWQPDTKLDATELKRALKRCMGLGGALGRLGGEPGALRVDDEAGMEQLVSPDQTAGVRAERLAQPVDGDCELRRAVRAAGRGAKAHGRADRRGAAVLARHDGRKHAVRRAGRQELSFGRILAHVAAARTVGGGQAQGGKARVHGREEQG